MNTYSIFIFCILIFCNNTNIIYVGEKMKLIKKNKKVIISLCIILMIIIVSIVLFKILNKNEKNVVEQGNSTITKINVEKYDYKLCEFAMDNCNGCDVINPIFEEIKAIYKDRLEFEYIDVEYKPNLANKYLINTVPTFIIIDKEGKVKSRFEGVISKEEFIQFVDNVLNKT